MNRYVCAVFLPLLAFVLALAPRVLGQTKHAAADDQPLNASAPHQAHPHDDPPDDDRPTQRLQHFPDGEWRMGLRDGRQQRDVWAWGPSRLSLTSVTTNTEGTSESVFGSFRVIYDHPHRDGLSVVALSGRELIHTGTLTAPSERELRFDMTLFYDVEEIEWALEPTRTISSVWTFASPGRYTNAWVEDQGQAVAPGMTAWVYTKHPDVTPPPGSAAEPPDEVRHLVGFVPLMGSAWETDTTRTSFDWIPYNEAVLMRTTDTRTGDLIVERVFFPHPHTKAVHAIGIHSSRAVDEGTVTLKHDTVVISADRSDREGATRIEERIGLSKAGTLRIETWAIDGTDRTRLAETTHRAAAD